MNSVRRLTPLFLAGLAAALAGCDKKEPAEPVPSDPREVRVVSFLPQGVVETMPLEVRFSAQLATPDEVGVKRAEPALLEIQPPLPGTYEWTSRDTLTFVPSEPFRRNTRYLVKVLPEVLAQAGDKKLGGDTEYEFSTLLFDLVSVQPLFSGAGSVEVRVNLEFTHPVKPSAASQAIRFVDAQGQPIDATLETAAEGPVMAFKLSKLPATQDVAAIKVLISRDLGPTYGGELLGKDLERELTFTRPQALVVDQIYPVQEGGQYVVYVRFGDEVETASAEAALSISPKGKYTVSQSYRALRVSGPFRPGNTYEFTVRKGLVGRQGGMLESDVTRQVMIADLEPQLRFAAEGSYLMKGGKRKLSLESVNISKVRVTVDKIFENNLVHVIPRLRTQSRSCWDDGCYDDYGHYEYYDDGGGYYHSYYDVSTMGSTIFQGEIAIDQQKNEWRTSAISFDQIHQDQRTGLYRLRVTDTERGWSYVEKWLLSTDLALTAKMGGDEARVQVISLSTLEPVAGVEVSFVSQNNQLAGKAITDAKGIAVQSLKAVKPDEPIALITAKKEGDFSYLALANTAIPTADFEVGGQGDTTAPYEAYVYPDRGVYRPGDTAKVTVLVRDKSLKTPAVFPYVLEVRNPRWQVFKSLRGSTDQDGAHVFKIDFPVDVLTGNYSVRVLAAGGDTILGRETLKVEEFMPDRIKVEVTPKEKLVEPGQPAQFTIQSNYLFGPPAKGLKVANQCVFAETGVETKTFSSFSFASPPPGYSPLSHTEDLGEGVLDAEGAGQAECLLAAGNSSSGLQRPVRVTLFSTVSENGGRAVTGGASAMLHAHPHYVGVRRNSKSLYAEVGKPAGTEIMVVDREGQPKAGVEVVARLVRIEWKSVLKLDGGRYRYVSEQSEEQVGEIPVTSATQPVAVPFSPARAGYYRVDVTAAPSGASSSMSFWVSGGGWNAWEMSKPDQVALTLDKQEYAPGENAKLMVRAPFDGHLYLTIERDRVLHSVDLELKGNTATVMLPVSMMMTPNAYIVAQLVRSPKSVEQLAPMRAFGIVPLVVNADQHRLAVSLAAPEVMRPGQTLELELAVQGGKGAVQATIAAVDEGILRITGFETPDPFAFFTRKRRLGISTHDLFELLLPEVAIEASALVRASGGDTARQKHLSPVSVKRVKPVALWSGLVKLDAAGKAKVKLEVPSFQGSLRIMAVAFEAEKFGSVSKNVTVRDPIVLTPTLPRFVGPLDTFKVPVEVYNGTGKDGEMTVRVEIQGRLKVMGPAEQRISVKNGEQAAVEFQLQADEVAGAAKVTIHGSGNGEKTWSATELPIRPAATVTAEGASLLARPDQPAKLKVPGGFMEGTIRTQITVGAAPSAQFGAALQYLIGYPYGCLEQTVSRAFPLLYLKDLAKVAAPELAKDGSIDGYVDAGISRVSSMMTPSGGLSYWPGSSWGYAWSTVYGAHFLVEAKKAGYAVDSKLLGRLIDHLTTLTHRGVIPFYRDSHVDFRSQVYALYVLSSSGHPNQSALLYAADQVKRTLDGKLTGRDAVPVDDEIRALLGGALLLGGDKARANTFVSADFNLARQAPQTEFWSSNRADAVMLSVLAEVQPTHRSVPVLMRALISKAQNGRWYNTQENAFALVALGKIGRALGAADYTGKITVGGVEVKRFSDEQPAFVLHEKEDWVGKEIEVSIEGTGVAFVGILVEGIKAGMMPARSNGLTVERTYLSKDGAAVDPAKISQGDLLVTRIELSAPPGSRIDNVAIADLLPAGLEIENPRLGNEAVLPFMSNRTIPDYVDIRDDRLLLFTSIGGGNKQVFYYTVRAVTAGDFVLPHIHAEAMYDPATQSDTGAGRVVVSQ